MREVICIRHHARAPLGILRDVFDRERVAWRYVDAWRGTPLPDPRDTAGVVVLGGDMNVDQIDEHPHLEPVRDLVRNSIEGGVPLLGVCLGAQLISRALDAGVHRAGVREIGFRPIRSTEVADPVLAPFAPESRVFQFHEDECDLPAGAELLFSGDDVEVQAFRVGRAYGVQFHFEVRTKEIEAWCDGTRDLEETWGTTKADLLAEARHSLPEQQQRGRAVARAFLEIVRDRP